MLRAIERGLSLQDFNELTVGMILGYVTTYNNENNQDKEEKIRMANQNDYDAF